MNHGLRFDVNCSILFPDVPLLERPAAARAAGFDAVEFWWPFPVAVPSDREIEDFVESVSEAGASLVGLNFFAGDMSSGDRGLFSWPGRAAELRENITVAVDIGTRLGCTSYNALYGNRIEGASTGQQDDLAVENLAIAASAVEGGVVLVEPISGAPRYPLRLVADVVAVIDRVQRASGLENLKILADLYHLAINGEDLPSAVIAEASRVGHVQIADAPGRNAPGTGELPLDDWLVALEAAGYRGRVGLEYLPDPAGEDEFAWLASVSNRSGQTQERE